MRIVTWNVNGLRSAAGKGFLDVLGGRGLDVLGVQESRLQDDQITAALRAPHGFHSHFRCADRKGYSGVALYSRRPFDAVDCELGEPRFDCEGRVQLARLGRLLLANVYFPNGSGKERDNSRVPYKLDFYRALFARLEPERAAGVPILVMGDFNTAHREIDLARPRQNERTSGFLPEERAELARWLDSGWTDTFRAVHGDVEGAYSWWSQRFGVREKNVGWRIDYVLASPAAMAHVRDAFLWPDVKGSDHCPAGVDLDDAVLADQPPASKPG